MFAATHARVSRRPAGVPAILLALSVVWASPAAAQLGGLVNKAKDKLVRDAGATGLTHVGQRLEPGEEITVETVPSVEVWPMIRDGAIRDGKTIAALALWFGFAATPSCAAFHVGTAR